MHGKLGAALAAALVLHGCGEGKPDIRVTVTGVRGTQSSVYEGQHIPHLAIDLEVSGEVSKIDALYLGVTYSQPSMFGDGSISGTSDGRHATITLYGAIAPAGPATHTGNIHLLVCLDAGCASPVEIRGADVPYAIQVKKGLTLGATEVALETPFGSVPAPVVVPVGLPDGVVSWSLGARLPGETGPYVEKAGGGSAALVVPAPEVHLPGTANPFFARVWAVTPDGQTLERTLKATLVTLPSDLIWSFQRPVLRYALKQGQRGLTERVNAGLLFRDFTADHVTYAGTTYSWPPGADGSAFPIGWIYSHMPDLASPNRYTSPIFTSEIRVQGCYDAYCLPVGSYGAVIHYRYDGAPLDYPVEMEIVP